MSTSASPAATGQLVVPVVAQAELASNALPPVQNNTGASSIAPATERPAAPIVTKTLRERFAEFGTNCCALPGRIFGALKAVVVSFFGCLKGLVGKFTALFSKAPANTPPPANQ